MKTQEKQQGDITLLLHRLFHFGFTYGDYMHLNSKPPLFMEFSNEVAEIASKYENMASEAIKNNKTASARHYYNLAARYYHFAQLFMPPAVPAKEMLRKRSRTAFRSFVSTLGRQFELFTGSYDNLPVPGYIHIYDKEAPTVIFINGLDSSKEVELATFGRYFYERGMNVVAFDGPGQGELRKKLKMTKNNHAELVSEMIDFLLEKYSLSAEKLGVFGVSFGGYLAPRAAVHDKRFKACISLSGPYSYNLSYVPPIVLEDFKEQYGLYEAGSMMDFSHMINLDDIKGELVCPSYIIIGEKDHLLSDEEKDKLEDFPAGEKKIMRLPLGEHVCSSYHAEILPMLADWMSDRLH